MEKMNTMLIDFSSPARKNELALPLIPVPPQIPSVLPLKEGSESPVDPFEVQGTEAPDPFDVVFCSAARSCSSEQTDTNKHNISQENRTENILIKIQSEDNSLNLKNIEKEMDPFSLCSSCVDKTQVESDQTLSRPRNEVHKDFKVNVPEEHPCNSDHKDICDTLKNSQKSLVAIENDSQCQISTDFSTEESLKAAIAKRVNRCIQETLNGSMKTNKNSNDSLLKKPQNKRSLSFIGLPSASVKNECDRLNKSCTDVNDSFNLENQQLDALNDSSGIKVLSPDCTDVEEGNGEDNKLFKEARKLSRTFSKLAESFRKEKESDSDDEDLMSCKPKWFYADSSEDEEERLRKDPALNFRRRSDGFSSPAPEPPSAKVSDSPALLAYKSRRSFTQLHAALNNTQDELTIKKSISVESKLKDAPVISSLIATGPVNVLNSAEIQPIKLRKKTSDIVKRGPMRAVVPVQSMTKESIQVPDQTTKPDTSPEARVQKRVFAIGTPVKDNSQLNIIPMASSTPNKDESFSKSKPDTNVLMKPVQLVAANKRHSLEGSFSHKSRDASSEGGAKLRSSSVNSGIPRVSQAKALRSFPSAPKSTSNLARPANTHLLKNAGNVLNVLEKKNSSPLLKNNVKKSRVLAEVKSKSPLQSKVRTAVNTISSLVRGKKFTAQDKENRVPA